MSNLPAWAYEIEVGDPICDKNFTQIGGFVLKHVTIGGKKKWPAYLVENRGGQQFIIPEDYAKLMGGPEQKYLAKMYELQERRSQL